MENKESGVKQLETSKKGKQQKFEPGQNYYSPYKEPKSSPKGYFWVPSKRSEGDRGYVTHWTLQSTDSEPPSIDELPPVEGLLTKEEFDQKMAAKMENNFEKFGDPSKGSQPSGDFEPDE